MNYLVCAEEIHVNDNLHQKFLTPSMVKHTLQCEYTGHFQNMQRFLGSNLTTPVENNFDMTCNLYKHKF